MDTRYVLKSHELVHEGFWGGGDGMSKMTISPHTERRTLRDSNYFFCPTIATSLAETLVPFVYSGHNKLKIILLQIICANFFFFNQPDI